MWNTRKPEATSISNRNDLSGAAVPACQLGAPKETALRAQSTVGQGLILTGQITGSMGLESLIIEGTVEGNIHLPASSVVVGRGGQVKAGITARDIVVMGKIFGNVKALDRIEIRADAAVVGDACAPRICIKDGACFRGNLDIRNSAPEAAASKMTDRSLLELPSPILKRPNAKNNFRQRLVRSA